MPITLSYSKTQTQENRNSINEEIIKCCENLDVDRLFEILSDSYIFEKYEVFEGLANFRDKFNNVKATGIVHLESGNSVCSGCEIGHVVKAFHNSNDFHFALMFKEADGIADQVIFCADFIKKNLSFDEIKREQEIAKQMAGYNELIASGRVKFE